MNKKIRKWMFGLLGTALALSLAACGGSSTPPADTSESEDTQSTDEKQVTIGVIQIAEHAALDAAREGFIDFLNENDYEDEVNVKYDIHNAQGDMNNATSIAQKLVGDKVDLILAIGTPSAQAAAQATKDIPIVLTAVTDPVDAKVVNAADKPGTNVTGTSDMNPIKEQLELIKEIDPEAEKVGVIYKSGEDNSILQVRMAKEYAEEYGLEIIERTISNSSEVKQAVESLPKVDAIYIPTDNEVISALSSVLIVAEEKQLPVVVGEAEPVKNGALITYGIDYYKLGRQTGEMASKILNKEGQPENMAIETQKELELTINKKAAIRFGVSIPKELMDRADNIIE